VSSLIVRGLDELSTSSLQEGSCLSAQLIGMQPCAIASAAVGRHILFEDGAVACLLKMTLTSSTQLMISSGRFVFIGIRNATGLACLAGSIFALSSQLLKVFLIASMHAFLGKSAIGQSPIETAHTVKTLGSRDRRLPIEIDAIELRQRALSSNSVSNNAKRQMDARD